MSIKRNIPLVVQLLSQSVSLDGEVKLSSGKGSHSRGTESQG